MSQITNQTISLEAINLDTIDHIAINVSNIDDAIAWYQTSFSCELLSKTTTFALLQFQNIKLALHLPSQQRAHLAFPKHNAETYGELRPQPDGQSSTFLSDSTGNIIELIKK